MIQMDHKNITEKQTLINKDKIKLAISMIFYLAMDRIKVNKIKR